MAINHAEQVESAVAKTPEAATLASPQISAAENQKLNEVRTAASASLKSSGILPELAITNDLELVQKNFDKLDKSKDGHITKEELDDYIKNAKNLKPEEAAAMKRVGEQIGKLEEASNDETGDENDGITKNDLKGANENAKAMDYAQRNFEKLDGNGDGHVTADELDVYARAKGGKMSADERANIDTLKKNMSDLEEYSNDEKFEENSGFTRHDLVKGRSEEGFDTLKTNAQDDQGSSYGDLRPALDYTQKNFDKMDADHDGYISADEIDQHMQANKDKLSGEQMQNLRALKEKVGTVEELSNDELGDENNGISKKDIAAAKEEIDTLAYAQKNFEKLDGNGDGHVTEDEIEGYIRAKGDDISADELKKLETLKKQVGELEEKHNDEFMDEDNGFTRHDLIDALGELGSAGARDGKPGKQEGREKPGAGCEVPGDKPGETPGQNPEDGKNAGDNASTGSHEYTIKKGDSFWKIAKDNLRAQNGKDPSNAEVMTAMNELAKANGMKLTDTIHPGQKLKVPGAGGAEKVAEPRSEGGQKVKPEPRTGRKGDPQSGTRPEAEGRKEKESDPEAEPQERAKPKTERLSASQVMRNRFSEMDKNGNNHVDRKEIEKYINENKESLTVEETKALDKMAKNVGKIEELANDERGDENSGISRQDLDKLDQLQKASAQFLNGGKFDSLDANHNNFLSKDEITKALTTQRLSREERLTLEFLKDNLKLLEKGNNDERGSENNGFSHADLRHYATLA